MTRDEIFIRQHALLARSGQLRLDVATHSQGVKQPLAVVDLALDGIRWLRQHPEWPIGAAVVLVVARPRRVFTWSQRIWWAWRLFRRGQSWVDAHR